MKNFITPKVSAIVPVYNVEKFLDRCISSLVNQTLNEIEIILVDDGSLDNCPNMCDEYKNSDARIKVIHKKNQGLGLARNAGMNIANGKYVIFIDSDDYIEKTAFEKLYECAEKYKADMCMANYFKYKTYDNSRKEIKIFKECIQFSGNEILDIACGMVGALPNEKTDEKYGMSVWKNIYSLDFLRKHNIAFLSEREFVSEDAIFHLIAVPQMNKIVGLPISFYNYCNNNTTSLSTTFKREKFEQYKKLYYKEIELLSKFDYVKKGRYYIARTFLGNIRSYIKQLVESDFSKEEKMNLIKHICEDKLVQNILNWYPYNENPIKQRLLSILLKNKNIIYILKIAYLQNKFGN